MDPVLEHCIDLSDCPRYHPCKCTLHCNLLLARG
jgi:hypothetical protein